MQGKWLGFPLIFLLLLAAAFSFINDEVVEDWLKNNSITIQKDDADILSIQEIENWPVIIVDFNGKNVAELNND